MCAFIPPNDWKMKNKFEDATLYDVEGINTIVLRGSFYEMGKQYGTLLKHNIKEMSNIWIYEILMERTGLTYQELEKLIFENYWDGLQLKYRKFIQGMSETSGVSIEKIILINAMLRLAIYFKYKLFPRLAACSCIMATGDYTVDGSSIIGRNFDWTYPFADYKDLLVVTVFCPKGEENRVATVGYAGMLSCLTGINGQGLYVEQNVTIQGIVNYPKRKCESMKLLEILFESESLASMNMAMNSMRGSWTHLVGFSDDCNISCLEIGINDVKAYKEFNYPSLLAFSNHYQSSDWGVDFYHKTPEDTLERKANLINLGNKYRGKIDAKLMCDILSIPFEEGGALVLRDTDAIDETAYQLVASMKNKQLWLRTPHMNEWVHLDFSKL